MFGPLHRNDTHYAVDTHDYTAACIIAALVILTAATVVWSKARPRRNAQSGYVQIN